MFVKGKGTFYNFHKGKAASHFNSISISNGVAFNKDSTKLFYIDSIKKTIDVFDFDLKKGTIGKSGLIFNLRRYHRIVCFRKSSSALHIIEARHRRYTRWTNDG